MQISRENNFDMIRLVAAIQVVFWHSCEHMNFKNAALSQFVNIISYFPGVPIFFTVSGFLIYASYDRNSELKNYFRSRFLRIFPALWGCLFCTVLILFYFGYLNSGSIFTKTFLAWMATQLTFLQFYTPDMFRGFGVGTPNGSLWTIPVEISFYVCVPFLFYLIKRVKINPNALLLILCVLSFAYNYWYGIHYKTDHKQSAFIKLLGLNLVPYLFYFLLGSLAYTNWERIKSWYNGKGLIWLSAYILYFLIFSVWLKKYIPSYWPNFYGLIAVILLTQTVLALAFTAKNVTKVLLRGNDISYGVYLYHMLIVNSLIQLGYKGDMYGLLYVIIITLIMAFLSWWIIEKPALSLKRRAIIKKDLKYAN